MRVPLAAFFPKLLFVPAVLLYAAPPPCRPSVSLPSVSPGMANRYWSDPVLRRGWQVVTDCHHPNWPPQVLELSSISPLKKFGSDSAETSVNPPLRIASKPMIQAGARIELWRKMPVVIHLSGTALQTAQLGQNIRVRVDVSGKELQGIVCGPNSVQLVFDLPRREGP
jgi:Chaperone for flagella basal body P-ring formation